MFNVVFNNDSEKVLRVRDINYNISYQVGENNARNDLITCTIDARDIDKINSYENTPITTATIYKEESDQEVIVNLTFNNDFYVTSGSLNLYDQQALFNLTLSTIRISE